MRQSLGFPALAAIALALAVAACDNGPKNPVVTGLCDEAGSTTDCPEVPNTVNEAFFTITLESTSCTAKGTRIRVTAPVDKTLTDDGCYDTEGKTWNVGSASSGYAGGTQLNFSITSDETGSPPSFQLEGAYPDWQIKFEDGGDNDFNDVVLAVHATEIP
jgi:hypothetical protein